jgi:hypothetical protein
MVGDILGREMDAFRFQSIGEIVQNQVGCSNKLARDLLV